MKTEQQLVLDFPSPDEIKIISVVRLKTSEWTDKGGIHRKQTIQPLKRKSIGYQVLFEDASDFGALEVLNKIVNLDECKDGVYWVETCDESKDWETGVVDDYDYILVPFEK